MMKPTFEKLIESAKAFSSDTSAAEFGFETRLLATIRDKQNSEPGFLDIFGNWLWKGGLSVAPVVGIVLVTAAIYNGLEIPTGTSGVIGYLVNALPFSDSTLLSQ